MFLEIVTDLILPKTSLDFLNFTNPNLGNLILLFSTLIEPLLTSKVL